MSRRQKLDDRIEALADEATELAEDLGRAIDASDDPAISDAVLDALRSARERVHEQLDALDAEIERLTTTRDGLLDLEGAIDKMLVEDDGEPPAEEGAGAEAAR